MTHFRDVFLRGTLTAVEPFTFTEPDGEIRKVGEAKISVLPTIGGRYYVPGSMFRGALRRAATRELFDMAGGRRFNMDEYLTTVLGGIMTSKDDAKKKGTITGLGLAAQQTEANPVVELFGCMAPFTIPGCMAISHAIARDRREDQHDALVRGSRSNPAVRDRVLTSEVTDDEFEAAFNAKLGRASERSAASEAEKKASRALRKARSDADSEAFAKAAEEHKAAQADKQANKEVQVQQMLNYPFVPPGTVFDSTLRLMRVTETGLALFMRAFDRFAAYARLGAHAGQGMGLMDGDWEVLSRPSEDRLVRPERIGHVAFKGAEYSPAEWEGSPSRWADAAPDASEIQYLVTQEGEAQEERETA